MIRCFILALLISTVLGAPRALLAGCDVSKSTLTLPAGETALVMPTNTTPTFLALGVGVQNYTCSTSGTYTNVGALAELFDISCLFPALYDAVTDLASAAWNVAPHGVTAAEVIVAIAPLHSRFVLGQHYFVPDPVTGSGLSAKWDFTSASLACNPNAYGVGEKGGDIPAPADPAVNIDWLELNVVRGWLASQVFRTATRGGQPPVSCTAGSPEISVRYVSQYCNLLCHSQRTVYSCLLNFRVFRRGISCRRMWRLIRRHIEWS
ncbi:hypothetical protein B0H21DRAFT_698324 [Amylocystis lapponica]|nr:hypothetical protein B0H21DRAFT_698324 [Amylocystis lapponica]